MTKYLDSERFIVSSDTNEARKNYNDNYDRIFGEKHEPEKCPVCGEIGHERVEAFGGTVIGCPKVPPNTAVVMPGPLLAEALPDVDPMREWVEVGWTCPACSDPRGIVELVDYDERFFNCSLVDGHSFDDLK